MPYSIPDPALKLSFTQFVERLTQQNAVEGILTIGTTKGKDLKPYSDYDVVIVLTQNNSNVQLALGSIDGRLTDYLFASKEDLEEIISNPDNIQGWQQKIARWLKDGEIVFDRSGQLKKAKETVSTINISDQITEKDVYSAWFNINYNLKQNRRILASKDPEYLLALDIRLLYCINDLIVGYFTLRKLVWGGEKKAISYLTQNEPEFTQFLKKFFTQSQISEKMETYEKLAATTLSAVNQTWGENEIAFTPPESTSLAQNFWISLLEE